MDTISKYVKSVPVIKFIFNWLEYTIRDKDLATKNKKRGKGKGEKVSKHVTTPKILSLKCHMINHSLYYVMHLRIFIYGIK